MAPSQPWETTLQWSPVLETGNTRRLAARRRRYAVAAMEPGLRDREYDPMIAAMRLGLVAAMEPGLRDREYAAGPIWLTGPPSCCNGARS